MGNAVIQAKDARIFWSVKPMRVAVVERGRKLTTDIAELRYSGGACYSNWIKTCESSDQAATIMCLRLFRELVCLYNIYPEIVNEAFSSILEYK